MTDQNVLIVAHVLLKSAFFYGMAGGVAGYVFVLSVRALFGKIRGLFQWR